MDTMRIVATSEVAWDSAFGTAMGAWGRGFDVRLLVYSAHVGACKGFGQRGSCMLARTWTLNKNGACKDSWAAAARLANIRGYSKEARCI